MHWLTTYADQEMVQLMALFAVAAVFIVGCELSYIVAKAIIRIINRRADWQSNKESAL